VTLQKTTGLAAADVAGAWTLARLLRGEAPDGIDFASLPDIWQKLAVAVRDRRNGCNAVEIWESELALLPPDQAHVLRASVLTVDPKATPTPPQSRGMTAGELLKAPLPPLRWLVPDYVVRPGLILLGGAPKVGKSWLSLQIARAVARGGKVLDKCANSGSVIYFALEDGAARLQDRIRRVGWTGEEDVRFFFGNDLPHLDDGGLETLESDIATRHPVLVVIDSFAAAKSGKLDENDGGQVAELMYALSRLANDYDLSLIVVHHHRKMTTGSPLGDLRGSGALGGAADAILALYRERGAPECKLGMDSRDAAGGDWALGFTGCEWTMLGGAEIADAKKSERNIAKALRSLGPDGGTIDDVIHAAGGMRRQDALNALQALVAAGSAELDDKVPAGEKGGRPTKIYRFIGGEVV
jgi:hypothetical protein